MADGRCGCADNDDCAGNPQGGVCVTRFSICGCADDDDCAGFFLGDVCSQGLCSCNSADDCNAARTFEGTTFVCEAPDF